MLPVQLDIDTKDESHDFSLNLVRQWLSTCHSSHSQCRLTTGSQARKFFRILDVGIKEDFKDLQLCEAGEVPREAAYMTLSHCWGGLKIMKLTSDNYRALRNRINFDELPKTFQDAIAVTRSLGIQFLWIDSLCIIQDSEQDWRLQAIDIGEIYRYSWCNIAATAARDGRDGLFRYSKRNSAYAKRLKLHIADVGQPQFEGIESTPVDYSKGVHPNELTAWRGMAPGYHDCINRELWFREVSQSPLGRRAWVVQERLLSPRVSSISAPITSFGGAICSRPVNHIRMVCWEQISLRLQS
jgi:Heterokaryon incompatibility protein (HET)